MKGVVRHAAAEHLSVVGPLGAEIKHPAVLAVVSAQKRGHLTRRVSVPCFKPFRREPNIVQQPPALVRKMEYTIE